jgi:hypothetical protein
VFESDIEPGCRHSAKGGDIKKAQATSDSVSLREQRMLEEERYQRAEVTRRDADLVRRMVAGEADTGDAKEQPDGPSEGLHEDKAWCLNKFLVPARSPTRHLDPPGPCLLSLQAPGPAWTLCKTISATRGCPELSPAAKVGDLADTRNHCRHRTTFSLGYSQSAM